MFSPSIRYIDVSESKLNVSGPQKKYLECGENVCLRIFSIRLCLGFALIAAERHLLSS
ncbi:hypothetical protein PSAB6_620006 [Paraburkholderia sabiae]|nr:hypothetical protein PSAB6_620006 [Paraburkholderia sabiae]